MIFTVVLVVYLITTPLAHAEYDLPDVWKPALSNDSIEEYKNCLLFHFCDYQIAERRFAAALDYMGLEDQGAYNFTSEGRHL